ncbi:hypothetical protein OSB04_029326 [Centaurea solstitialis]|uniref:Secreted protein n=1 Tax=Centaurea solstitialis TaxID=347529 RepID=A0AA38SHF9_9ASTR|nr:hypothetical protein OSB04_029326 [Centaurea solstitialis]
MVVRSRIVAVLLSDILLLQNLCIRRAVNCVVYLLVSASPLCVGREFQRPHHHAVVATSRSSRLPSSSDSGTAFADWVANPSSSSAAAALRPSDQDLSLGFNAGPPTGGGAPSAAMWPSSASSSSSRQINYGLPRSACWGFETSSWFPITTIPTTRIP